MKPLNFIRAIIALSLLAGLLTLLFVLAFEFLAVVAAQVVNAVIMAGYIHS